MKTFKTIPQRGDFAYQCLILLVCAACCGLGPALLLTLGRYPAHLSTD